MSNDKSSTNEKRELVPSWYPEFGGFDRVFDNFKKDFEHLLAPSFMTNLSYPDSFGSSLACNISDEGDKFVITTDLPRIKKEEVHIDVGDTHIEISAQHKESDEEKKKKYLKKEQSEISVHRRMSLPEKVKPSAVKANLEHGVLTINLPKETPTSQPQSTKVTVE